jgi:hypothetical protein
MSAPLPLMDKWSRNARLYQTLVGMGLVVVPIPFEGDLEKIECLHVSSGLLVQQSAENPAVTSVSDTVERPQVRDVIAAAECSRGGVVVHFPSMLR